MSSTIRISKALTVAALAAWVIGCSDEHGPAGAGTSSSAAPPKATTSAAAAATASAPAPAPAAPAKPVTCPEGSSGEGSLAKPCEAKGKARAMEVTWTGKMDDAGPSFRVINKMKETILYGKIVVYFYDKAGKQLEVKEGDKTRPNQPCTGNLFSGVMKPDEKAVITFSCVKKVHVPEGTAAIEGELQTVGFADESGKRSEYYWRNNDLAPDTRPKGGVK